MFSPTPDYAGITHDLSRYGAEYMHETVKDGDIVGVSCNHHVSNRAKHAAEAGKRRRGRPAKRRHQPFPGKHVFG